MGPSRQASQVADEIPEGLHAEPTVPATAEPQRQVSAASDEAWRMQAAVEHSVEHSVENAVGDDHYSDDDDDEVRTSINLSPWKSRLLADLQGILTVIAEMMSSESHERRRILNDIPCIRQSPQGVSDTFDALSEPEEDVYPGEMDNDLLWRYEHLVHSEDDGVDCVRPFSIEHEDIGNSRTLQRFPSRHPTISRNRRCVSAPSACFCLVLLLLAMRTTQSLCLGSTMPRHRPPFILIPCELILLICFSLPTGASDDDLEFDESDVSSQTSEASSYTGFREQRVPEVEEGLYDEGDRLDADRAGR